MHLCCFCVFVPFHFWQSQPERVWGEIERGVCLWGISSAWSSTYGWHPLNGQVPSLALLTVPAAEVGITCLLSQLLLAALYTPFYRTQVSLGSGLCVSMCLYVTDLWLKLCWCHSGWWWYQLNTIDGANIKQFLAICTQCHMQVALADGQSKI